MPLKMTLHRYALSSSMSNCIIPIGFPPRTRVYHLERDVDDNVWNVWTALPHGAVNVPHEQRYGTFLRLWDHGGMERVTRDESGVRVMIIREPD